MYFRQGGYNSFGEPTEEVTRFDGTEVYANAYVRDSIGRITERTERVNGVSTTFAYSYDAAGRLFEVRENGVLSAHYEYDGNGNRILRRTSAGDEVGAYDSQDRVLSYGGETFTHTANGEWLTRTSGTGQTTRYAYDSRGNLVRVELPDGHVIEYVVDGANRRVGRRLDGVLTHQWLWQGQLRPAAELDGAGNLVSVFVYGLHVNVPELILRGGRIYRVVSDQLGSVRMVVDTQSGSVVQRMRYDEWGRVLEDTNTGWQPFGFAGGLWETRTGLVRFGARDYDAGVGRWLVRDETLFGGGSTLLYGYVSGDPVNYVDFRGESREAVGLIFLLGAALVSPAAPIVLGAAGTELVIGLAGAAGSYLLLTGLREVQSSLGLVSANSLQREDTCPAAQEARADCRARASAAFQDAIGRGLSEGEAGDIKRQTYRACVSGERAIDPLRWMNPSADPASLPARRPIGGQAVVERPPPSRGRGR